MKEKKRKKGSGGKRDGAGRKKKKETTVVVAARVKLSTEDKLKSLASLQQTTCSDIIEQLINKEPT